MLDAGLLFADIAENRSQILERLGLERRGYALATVHRAENTDDPLRLRAILGGLAGLARTLPVVLPLHPRTSVALDRLDPRPTLPATLRIVDPVGYLDMLVLERHARLIATDSGGVQKEAYFYRVPCVTLRDETEWVELVASGWNRLCPPGEAGSVASTLHAALDAEGEAVELYGDGHAAERIAALIRDGV
jgi:UDP-GlcNAc3NAcA epimerase